MMNNTGFLLTKIIATLGPASESYEQIDQLIQHGARVFRINFSHGSFEDYDRLVQNIRKAEADSGLHIAILGDLSGPKIRVGKVIKNGIQIIAGEEYIFTKKEVIAGSKGNENTMSSTFPDFIDEIDKDENILLDDGNVRLKAISKSEKDDDLILKCIAENDGLITTAKGINLPDTQLKVDALTEKDIECVEYAVRKDFDYLALSFVRHPKDIKRLKEILRSMGARPADLDSFTDLHKMRRRKTKPEKIIPVIAKIEKPQALANLKEIVRESDGVMVARGDLGVEMDLAEVTLLQKKIIHMCKELDKPVIVATQMLQSMINAPVPTRAEVSDIANAILDGADAIMLSGESAVGKYPVRSVSMMNQIALKTNGFIKQNKINTGDSAHRNDLPQNLRSSSAISEGVKTIADLINPLFIVVWTNRGGSAVFLSQHRLPVPILAFTAEKQMLRLLALLYGVKPLKMKQPASGSKFINAIDRYLISRKWAERNDPIIVVSGDPIVRPGLANRIVVHYVGEGVD